MKPEVLQENFLNVSIGFHIADRIRFRNGTNTGPRMADEQNRERQSDRSTRDQADDSSRGENTLQLFGFGQVFRCDQLTVDRNGRIFEVLDGVCVWLPIEIA
ncbi:MAG: hypothetical protein JWP89_533 [Schlesneria sp.]|nr:hypothetical protein [Schlesneria sp.]